MSRHMAFRRQPVDPQAAQQLRTINIPAPTRGLIMDENEAFMQPGGALIQDNWMPTMRGSKLRGGSRRWTDLHALDAIVPPINDPSRKPVISAFEYIDGNIAKMFAAQQTKLFDVSTNANPTLVKSGQLSGNYAAAQISSPGGNFLIAVNDAGDFPLQFDGSNWTTLNGGQINGPAGPVATGQNLTYVWKYRGRLFFIQANSMNAWYLSTINAAVGTLKQIPLSGAASLGGKLLFGASWSIDAGDGIDDKCVFCTDQGELLIYTGSDPSDINNWRQEGRYKIAPPMGMNAHIPLGGDLLVATVEGIVPVSQAITKTAEQLDLAALTRAIKPMWRDEVLAKRGTYPWTMEKWDEYGGIFVTWPGGGVGNRYCGVANAATGAWARFTGWDAVCFMRQRGDMFYGTQDGRILQCDRTGFDDAYQTVIGGVNQWTGNPYVCTLVGGWELFQSAAAQVTWHQARASFTSPNGQPFEPALDATTDYIIVVPPPPPPGPDPGLLDVWDQGLWDVMKFDQAAQFRAPMRNTMWRSIGKSGFSHAPICQVTVAQQATPNVELIAIAATFERGGVNVG